MQFWFIPFYWKKEFLQISGGWKTPVFCEGVEMVHFPHPNFGSQKVLNRFFLPGEEIHHR